MTGVVRHHQGRSCNACVHIHKSILSVDKDAEVPQKERVLACNVQSERFQDDKIETYVTVWREQSYECFNCFRGRLLPSLFSCASSSLVLRSTEWQVAVRCHRRADHRRWACGWLRRGTTRQCLPRP